MKLFSKLFKKNDESRPTYTPEEEKAMRKARIEFRQARIEEEKWEQRRYDLAKSIALQERKSVVLGKLNSSPEAIARAARRLADAVIRELRDPSKKMTL